MRKTLPLIAAISLPLSACMTSPYGSGHGTDQLSTILGSIGTMGSAYGSPYGYGYGGGFSQAAASACANYASRYGAVRVTSVRQTDYDRMRVYGHVSRGYGTDDWGCTFRSDGRVTDFDI